MNLEPINWHLLIGAFVSMLCGGIIGLERQLRGKPAGMRTSILVCMAAAAFTQLGMGIGDGADPARVLGQVVTGVGFLGGGVIFRDGSSVSGLTSAATILALAAVGGSIGVQHYIEAGALSLMVVFVLAAVGWLERPFPSLRRGGHGAGHDSKTQGKQPERRP